MPRFDIDYVIKGKVSITAPDADAAHEIFHDMDARRLDLDDKEITSIEKEENYDE